MDDQIAVTNLVVRQRSGTATSVTVEVGRPFHAEGGEWACPIHVSPMFGPTVTRGDDSFQALSLALRQVGQVLVGLADEGGQVLVPEGGQMFPLEAYLFLPTPREEFRPESHERGHVARRILGRWAITQVRDELGDATEGGGALEFALDGSGKLEVQSISAAIDYRWVPPLSDFTVRFTWHDQQTDNLRSGRGRASLVLNHSAGLQHDSLAGRVFVHNGPELAFIAVRA